MIFFNAMFGTWNFCLEEIKMEANFTKYKRKNRVGFDVDFFATPLGLVRVLETVNNCQKIGTIFWIESLNTNLFLYFQFLNVAGAISAFASASHTDIDFIKFLGISGFVFCFTNILLHLFNLDEFMPLWIYVEMGFTVLWSMLYIIGASIMTQWGARQCYQL